MKNIKIVTIALLLMTTTAFADFTIADLFVSGGTAEPIHSSNDREKKEHDCH